MGDRMKIETAIRKYAVKEGVVVTAWWEAPGHYAIGMDLDDGTTRAARFMDLGLEPADSLLEG